jgi:hypothetical protein
MKIARVLPVFSVAFAVSYVFAVTNNLAVFTYHPQLRQFVLGVEQPKAGPAMYWYGWIVTSAIAASLLSAIALALPRAWTARVWSGFAWLIPTAVMLFFVYLLKGYFLR